MKTKLYIALAVLSFLSLWCDVTAKKPLRSIEISLRGKRYQIRDVTTVSELQQRLFELSGQNETLQGRVEWKGRKLGEHDILRDVGVRDGAKLTLIPGDMNGADQSKADGKSSSTPISLREMLQQDFTMKHLLGFLEATNKDEVALLMKEGLEKSYYAMRKAYDDPNIRQLFQNAWTDPKQIEEVRQNIMNDPKLEEALREIEGLEEILHSPAAFEHFVSRLRGVVVHAGEAVLDGMLEVVLDVLRGSAARQAEAGAATTSANPNELYNFDDSSAFPTNVLFELSESEED